MKRWIWILLVLASSTKVVCAQPSSTKRASMEKSRIFDDVPREHWSYSALPLLLKFDSRGETISMDKIEILTRYEFAIATARALGRYESNLKINGGKIDLLTLHDVLVLMVYEYREELIGLGMRDSMGRRVWKMNIYHAFFQTHRFTPDEWFETFQTGEWRKHVVFPPEPSRPNIVPPPRLTIPAQRIFSPEKIEKSRSYIPSIPNTEK